MKRILKAGLILMACAASAPSAEAAVQVWNVQMASGSQPPFAISYNLLCSNGSGPGGVAAITQMTLRIFDSSNHEVATRQITDAAKWANGAHTGSSGITWDGRGNGSPGPLLPAGSYAAQIEITGAAQTASSIVQLGSSPYLVSPIAGTDGRFAYQGAANIDAASPYHHQVWWPSMAYKSSNARDGVFVLAPDLSQTYIGAPAITGQTSDTVSQYVFTGAGMLSDGHPVLGGTSATYKGFRTLNPDATGSGTPAQNGCGAFDTSSSGTYTKGMVAFGTSAAPQVFFIATGAAGDFSSTYVTNRSPVAYTDCGAGTTVSTLVTSSALGSGGLSGAMSTCSLAVNRAKDVLWVSGQNAGSGGAEKLFVYRYTRSGDLPGTWTRDTGFTAYTVDAGLSTTQPAIAWVALSPDESALWISANNMIAGKGSIYAVNPASGALIANSAVRALPDWPEAIAMTGAADGATYHNGNIIFATYEGTTNTTARKWGLISPLDSGSVDVSRSALVTAGSDPLILSHPAGQTVALGASVQLAVSASGTAPLHYQWKRGETVVGADSPTLQIPAVHASDAGCYSVTVSNTSGNAGSDPATLNVTGGADIPARFGKGAVLASQTRPTAYGDNQNEADLLFGAGDGANVRLAVTGNLQSSSLNGLILLLDTVSGGNRPFSYTGGDDSSRVTGMNGDIFDEAFNPDYAISMNNYAGTLYADFYDLNANSGAGSKSYLGGAPDGGSAVALIGGGELAFNNSNTQGVNGTGSPLGDPATATTGVEIALPLSRLGSPTGPIRVMALIKNNGSSHSNQTLPGLPDTYGNMDGPVDFSAIPGRQYVEMAPGISANELGVGDVLWAYTPLFLSTPADSSADAHPPVSSAPTAYNGRIYAVEDVEHIVSGVKSHSGNLIALNAATGALEASFGSAGRVALDGPVPGRIVLKGIGGAVRLFALTDKGTVYCLSTDGAIVWQASLGGTAASTPAVVDMGGAVVLAPVLSGGTWYVRRVDEMGTVSSTPALVGVTDITSSPSLWPGGNRMQVGAVTGTGGVVLAISTDSGLTIHTGATTAAPVKAAPVLSLDGSRFYVGTAPGSGDGQFLAFDSSTAAAVSGFAPSVSGGVDQSAFMDYPQNPADPCTLHFGSTAGRLYALRHTDASAAVIYGSGILDGQAVTGAPLLLKRDYADANGWMYAPTTQGLYVVNPGSPNTAYRYPVPAVAQSVSAVGRTSGSAVAMCGGTGNVYGVSAR